MTTGCKTAGKGPSNLSKLIFGGLMKKTFRSGQTAIRSGQYEIIGSRGGETGKERTVVKGEPLPPTPKAGQKYVLVDKTKN